ncbi:maleylpyruvate isomerase N-terminal domain-containing protein [Geodermatophilus sp. SYSU D00691]
MTGEHLRRAAAAARQVFAGADPAAPVPVMADDVAAVAGHLVTVLVWYSQDLAAGPVRTDAIELGTRAGAGLEERLRQLDAAATVLARTVDGAGPDERGWHDWGIADASGFAGMGCAELLVHAGDVAEARGLPWSPPADLADAVLARLFPWVPDDGDPAAALRWATGRTALPGRERVHSWRWHCAPLAEWDGALPG